jgi:hypothetical protein
MRDAQTMLAIMFRDKNQTITKAMSFLCAPATVDSRGPGGSEARYVSVNFGCHGRPRLDWFRGK